MEIKIALNFWGFSRIGHCIVDQSKCSTFFFFCLYSLDRTKGTHRETEMYTILLHHVLPFTQRSVRQKKIATANLHFTKKVDE